MNQPVSDFRNSALWSALEKMVAELTTTGEIAVNTAPAYVVTYLCQELSARKLVTAEALRPRPGSAPAGQ
jgi:hypothetical protein